MRAVFPDRGLGDGVDNPVSFRVLTPDTGHNSADGLTLLKVPVTLHRQRRRRVACNTDRPMSCMQHHLTHQQGWVMLASLQQLTRVLRATPPNSSTRVGNPSKVASWLGCCMQHHHPLYQNQLHYIDVKRENECISNVFILSYCSTLVRPK